MSGFKRRLLIIALLFSVLLIPRHSFALSAVVTQGLTPETQLAGTIEGDSYTYYCFNTTEGWLRYTLDGFYGAYGMHWVAPGRTGMVYAWFGSTYGWEAGTYTGAIQISSHTDSDPPATGYSEIPVTLEVIPPNITVSPTSIDVTVTQGLQPETVYFTVKNEGNIGQLGYLYYYISDDQDWINASTFQGFRGYGQPKGLYSGGTGTVRVDFTSTNGWALGLYTGTIRVSSGAKVVSIPVRLNVIKPKIPVPPPFIDVTVTQGLTPETVYFTVKNEGNIGIGFLYYHISDDRDWIDARTFQGFRGYGQPKWLAHGGTGTVRVDFRNTNGWAVGLYTGTIRVSSGAKVVSIPVRLNVIKPKIPVAPTSIDVTVTQGLTPEIVYFTVKNEGNIGIGFLYYYISDDRDWINARTFQGFRGYGQPKWLAHGGTGTVRVGFPSTNGWALGLYTGTIRVSSGAKVVSIPVRLNVIKPEIFVSPPSIYFPDKDEPNPYSKIITVENPNNIGTGFLYYSIGEEQEDDDIRDWLNAYRLPQFNGYLSTIWLYSGHKGRVRVNAYPYGLPDGVYKGKVVIRTGSAVEKVPVTLRVGVCELESAEGEDDSVRPRGTGGKTSTVVKITIKDPAPPGGCIMELDVEAEPGSGGHKHNGNRPTGTASPSKVEFLPGERGPREAAYTSSEVAGKEKIRYRFEGEAEWQELVNIDVKVDGLEPFFKSDYCRLTGQTNTHPSNHYATVGTKINTWLLCQAYYEVTGTTLGINDMSLEWGGLFDHKATWTSPHKSHRKGTSVDVDRWVYYAPDGKYILIKCEDDDELENATNDNHGRLRCESGGRKHIDF